MLLWTAPEHVVLILFCQLNNNPQHAIESSQPIFSGLASWPLACSQPLRIQSETASHCNRKPTYYQVNQQTCFCKPFSGLPRTFRDCSQIIQAALFSRLLNDPRVVGQHYRLFVDLYMQLPGNPMVPVVQGYIASVPGDSPPVRATPSEPVACSSAWRSASGGRIVFSAPILILGHRVLT